MTLLDETYISDLGQILDFYQDHYHQPPSGSCCGKNNVFELATKLATGQTNCETALKTTDFFDVELTIGETPILLANKSIGISPAERLVSFPFKRVGDYLKTLKDGLTDKQSVDNILDMIQKQIDEELRRCGAKSGRMFLCLYGDPRTYLFAELPAKFFIRPYEWYSKTHTGNLWAGDYINGEKIRLLTIGESSHKLDVMCRISDDNSRIVQSNRTIKHVSDHMKDVLARVIRGISNVRPNIKGGEGLFEW